MLLDGNLGHLTYSTLVHPGDTWEQMWDSLTRYVPTVKRRFSPNKPFGISLRISRNSADRLTGDDRERQKLKDFLAANDMYLFTANAFPYGTFKGERVKELVYEPDWRTDDRAEYTMKVADILADVAPEGVSPSIQSPPLGFKPRVTGSDVIDAFTRQVGRTVAHLIALERKTGRTVTLALEPEPACFLELTSETVDYFTNHLYATASVQAVAKQAGLTNPQAEVALRRHLGTVYDICHQAVEFEDVPASLKSLRQAGIPVMKLQAAAAVWIPEVTRDAIHALKSFDDPVYLHQTVERRGGELSGQFLDLPDAFEVLGQKVGPAGMAHPFPCAGIPRNPRRVQNHAARYRGGAGGA